MICTIAILFYNSEKYLSYAVQSVLNQTFQDWELLLIDDGSNDSSLQIAQSFANKDVRIRVIRDLRQGLMSRYYWLEANSMLEWTMMILCL